MTLSYEDTMGPLARRIARITRACRWVLKGCLGKPRTMLVELNWRLGDEIMALPVLEALHKIYPKDRLVMLTHYPDLLLDNKAISAVNPASVKPDRYVLLRGASRRAFRRAEYSANCGIPTPGVSPRLRYENWDTNLLSEVPDGDAPLIVLAPGASWPGKRWPAERWNDLAAKLAGDGLRLIVLGAEGEGLARGVDFTGRTAIREAACLLHAADLVICCDSGLMHLALAANTPTLALFGPTDPDFLIRHEPNLIALRSTAPCAGFWNHADAVGEPGECPEGHASCLETISINQVYGAALETLRKGGA